MSSTLVPPAEWAREQFGGAKRGEDRLNGRLVKIATKLAGSPGGTWPQAFRDWAELKAAYRFLANGAVHYEEVLQPHVERTRASFGPEARALLEKRYGRPKGGWTNRHVLVATARLGGFLARQCDGMPGWQTIWRGGQRLRWMCEGLETLSGE